MPGAVLAEPSPLCPATTRDGIEGTLRPALADAESTADALTVIRSMVLASPPSTERELLLLRSVAHRLAAERLGSEWFPGGRRVFNAWWKEEVEPEAGQSIVTTDGDEEFLTQFAGLDALYEDPELLKPPQAIVPRLAWRGYTTMLAATDKAGKSTLARHAVHAVARGSHFLGEPTGDGGGRTLWVGLEEAPGHAVARFEELGTPGAKVDLVTASSRDVLRAIRHKLHSGRYDLVVVDTLQEYARVALGEAPSDGDNSGWGTVVRPLVELSREYDVAAVVLHHTRRSDNEARGAGESFAAVDVVLTMKADSADPRVRWIKGRGRWDVETFAVALRGGRYELHSGSGASVESLVVDHVRRHPRCSRNEVCQAVGKAKQTVTAAINRLVERQILQEEKGARGAKTLLVRDPELHQDSRQ